MNKIYNALGSPGSLKTSDIHWDIMPDGKEVPVALYISNSRANEIWKRYFHLLFLQFDLLGRINQNIGILKKKAGDFYNYLLSDGVINKNKLLQLLTENPSAIVRELKIKVDVQGINAIKKVFDYKEITKAYRKEYTELILLLDVNVCPYCGRSFTTTVIKDEDHFIRACQIDHFYSQANYPWLALSLWNMIPSCGVCNLHKSAQKKPILYPYQDAIGDMYRFRTHPVKSLSYLVGALDSEEDFTVSLDSMIDPSEQSVKSDYEKQIDNEIEMFKINELYSTHNNYVSNIFRQRYIFGTPYIDSLVSSFRNNIFRNRDDVKAMMYLKRIDAESIGNHPLDKLTRDIDYEIELLEEQ